MTDYDSYVNGYIERAKDGYYVGSLRVEGVNLSPIEGQYFKKDNEVYLFIKRRPIMEYNYERDSFITRERTPQVLIYMKKQVNNDGVVAYKGEFMFMRFKFHIEGIWDKILGNDMKRLNLYVERAPIQEQTLLQNIAKAKERK